MRLVCPIALPDGMQSPDEQFRGQAGTYVNT